MTVSLREALDEITTALAAAGIDNPRREARLILAAANETDAAGLLTLAQVDEHKHRPMLRRRAAREPLAYILGAKEFWGLAFEVSPATLIPRPDSETLVEAALAASPAPARVLDLGTGTGCLLLAVLHERAGAFGIGVDNMPAAVRLARRNAAALGMAERTGFLVGDWAAALAPEFDLILANPPYIPASQLAGLMPEVACYEPANALAGGADGLACYRTIIAALPQLLARNGAAVLELGAGQSHNVAALAYEAGLAFATHRDLGGHERAALCTWPK